MNKYICAFRGRRDNYQVPLALAESGKLDKFITDFYTNNFLEKITPVLHPSWQNKLNFRLESQIPSEQIKSLWKNTLLEHICKAFEFSDTSTFH